MAKKEANIGAYVATDDQLALLLPNTNTPTALTQTTSGKLRTNILFDKLLDVQERTLNTLDDISVYLEQLTNSGSVSSSQSSTCSVANDQILKTNPSVRVVTGRISISVASSSLASSSPGSFVEIELNGHSLVTLTASFPGSYTLIPERSVDGETWITSLTAAGDVLTNGSSFATTYAVTGFNAGAFVAITCGMKKFRVWCSSFISVGGFITLRATYEGGAFLQAMQSGAVANSTTVFNYAGVLPTTTTGAILNATTALIPRCFQSLQISLVKGSIVSIYGIVAFNPNPSTIFLLFYNATTVVSVLNGTTAILWWMPVPPGFLHIPGGHVPIGASSTGLVVAASTTPTAFVKVSPGPNVTLMCSF